MLFSDTYIRTENSGKKKVMRGYTGALQSELSLGVSGGGGGGGRERASPWWRPWH